MRPGASAAPRTGLRARALVTPFARQRTTILSDFRAPDYRTLILWPGFAPMTRSTQAVLQYLAAAMDGCGLVVLSARQIGYDLSLSVRSVRSATFALRLAGLVLTYETRNPRGGSGPLCWSPGPTLRSLARASRAPGYDTPPKPDLSTEKSMGYARSEHSDLGGANYSPLIPIEQQNNRNFDVRGSPDPAAGVQRRPPPGVPLVGPQERLSQALTAALGAGGRLTPADRRMCLVISRIAVRSGSERAALNVAGYAGRVKWSKCRGALLRQRYIDALDAAGLGDRFIPREWQGLRRSEAVRNDRKVPEVPQKKGMESAGEILAAALRPGDAK